MCIVLCESLGWAGLCSMLLPYCMLPGIICSLASLILTCCDGLPEDLDDLLLMQLHFADDSQEQPVEIHHKLKLYDEADPNNPSTKKPVRHLLKAASPGPQPLKTDSVVTNAR